VNVIGTQDALVHPAYFVRLVKTLSVLLISSSGMHRDKVSFSQWVKIPRLFLLLPEALRAVSEVTKRLMPLA